VPIPHWIDHNKEHADEFRSWSEQAGDATADILAAADAMLDLNKFLVSALEKLGGALAWSYDQRESDDAKSV
jgi:hypothetical protein